MPFESISRKRFDAFQPPSLVLKRLTVEQVEWFTNTVGNIIGTIAGKEMEAAEKAEEEFARLERRKTTMSRRP